MSLTAGTRLGPYEIQTPLGAGGMGEVLTDTVVARAEHTLVITGPYRRVQHPFYSAVFLFVVAASLVSAN